MQSTLLRLAVALLAFGVGVSATMFWIAYRTPDVERLKTTACRMRPLPTLLTVEEMPPLPGPPKSPVRIPGGLLDDEVIRKPAPVAPPDAAEITRASGEALVEVHVLVGVEGKVNHARAMSGDPLLRAAAEAAAYRAEFMPPRVQGEPAYMTGTLSYDFASERTHRK